MCQLLYSRNRLKVIPWNLFSFGSAAYDPGNIYIKYGYAAVIIGSFFDGETVIVLAGFAAHQGYLKLPFVLAFGFLGAILGDQLYFHIGRIKGLRVLNALPHGDDKSDVSLLCWIDINYQLFSASALPFF